jgi:hypothetical protein
MTEYIKIEKNTFYSLISELRHQYKGKRNCLELIEEIQNGIIDKSDNEVTTYSEKEFVTEKRRYLMSKGLLHKLDSIELKMMEDLTKKITEYGDN